MLGQLTGQQQADSGLDFTRGDGGLFVVRCQLGSFTGDTTEHIVDERVQDGDGLVGDTDIGVDLLQHLVDVRVIGFLARLLLLLLALVRLGLLAGGLLGGGLLRGGRRRDFGRHDDLGWWAGGCVGRGGWVWGLGNRRDLGNRIGGGKEKERRGGEGHA